MIEFPTTAYRHPLELSDAEALERVTGFDTPYPHSLEWAYFPGPVRIASAIEKIMKD